MRTELELGITQTPDDSSRFAAYGDLLTEEGDVRGELIALELELANGATGLRAATLRARRTALFAQHEAVWVGSLAQAIRNRHLVLRWEYGFIAEARVGHRVALEAAPHHTLTQLLQHPSARFLRALDLSLCSTIEMERALDACALPALRTLAVGTYAMPLFDWSTVAQRAPGLRALVVGGRMTARSRLPTGSSHLVDLELNTLNTNLEQAPLHGWPALERLTVWLDAKTPPQSLLHWLDGAPDGLRVLRLQNAPRADEYLEVLLRWRGLPRLAGLELSLGGLSSKGAETLITHAASFRHLQRLGVLNSRVGLRIQPRLREALPQVELDPYLGRRRLPVFPTHAMSAVVQLLAAGSTRARTAPEDAIVLLQSAYRIAMASAEPAEAARACLALVPLFLERNVPHEAIRCAEQLLELERDLGHNLSRAFELLGRALYAASNLHAACEAWEEALLAFRSAPQPVPDSLRLTLAHALLLTARPERARQVAEEGLKDAQRQSPELLNILGFALQSLGAFDEAAASYGASLANDRADESRYATMLNLAGLERLRGDLQAAVEWTTKAVETAERSGHAPGHADAIATRGQLMLNLGRIREAVDDLTLGLSLMKPPTDMVTEGFAQVILAEALHAAGDSEGATRHAKRGLVLQKQAGNAAMQAQALLVLATVETSAERAWQLHLQGLELAKAGHDAIGTSSHLVALGTMALREEDDAEAQRLFEEALALPRAPQDNRWRSWCELGLGCLAYAHGRLSQARHIFEQAIDAAAKANDVVMEGVSRGHLSAALGSAGDVPGAREQLALAQRLFDGVGAVASRRELQPYEAFLDGLEGLAVGAEQAALGPAARWLRRGHFAASSAKQVPPLPTHD